MGASILQCSWGLMSGAINSDEQYLDERSIEANAFAHFINTKRPGSPLNGGIIILRLVMKQEPVVILRHILRWFV